jgi:hypothetical protein
VGRDSFRFLYLSVSALGSTQLRIQRLPEAVYPGVKQPEREVHCLPTSSDLLYP